MKLVVTTTFLLLQQQLLVLHVLHSFFHHPSLVVVAQQAGTNEQEGNPTITLKQCTIADGCTSRQAKLTLDANWRWIHNSASDNCYTGNEWDTSICPDPQTCAQDCALEGVSAEKYESTYGIESITDGVKMKFVTEHQYGSNVGARLYVMAEDGENYELFYLKNREFSFEVNVSELLCGMNGAMYFCEMAANGGKGLGDNNAGAKFGTGYCDAQCPHDIKFIAGEANVIDWRPNPKDKSNNMGIGKFGSCCAEMDIWEANSMATAYTPHTCGIEGQLQCEGIHCGDNDKGERYEGVCDKDGCDINPYRMGNTDFYGRGSDFNVDTTKPMTVVTQFLTDDGTDEGDLSEIKRFYVQDGNIIHSPTSTILGPDNSDSITDDFCDAKKDLFEDIKDFQEHGGMKGMGKSLDRGQVMIFSLWDDVDVNMLWLDSAYPLDKPVNDPGIKRGECPGGDTSTPTYLRKNFPNAYVEFKNAAVGEIGSTLVPVNPTPTPAPAPTPPTTCDTEIPCCSRDFKDCVTYCGSTKSECLNCHSDNVHWIDCPNQNCKPISSDCTNDIDACCDGLTCVGNEHYRQCRFVEKPPTDSPSDSPVETPAEQCFSNNFKDCLPEGYPNSDGDGDTYDDGIWLPNGPREDCSALWGRCDITNSNDCCPPGVCYGDDEYAACVRCTMCTDKAPKNWKKGCARVGKNKLKCKKNSKWIKKQYCQLSCFNAGKGYDGVVCCEE